MWRLVSLPAVYSFLVFSETNAMHAIILFVLRGRSFPVTQNLHSSPNPSLSAFRGICWISSLACPGLLLPTLTSAFEGPSGRPFLGPYRGPNGGPPGQICTLKSSFSFGSSAEGKTPALPLSCAPKAPATSTTPANEDVRVVV